MQVVVSRMRFIASQAQAPMRFVGLSTSLANARDVGEWLGATSHATFNFPPGGHCDQLDCGASSGCPEALPGPPAEQTGQHGHHLMGAGGMQGCGLSPWKYTSRALRL